MAELGEVVATIDNEPGNVNLFHRQFPDAINVLIHTNAAPGAPDPVEGLSHIDDFASWSSEGRVATMSSLLSIIGHCRLR